jgi:hypothetical protein
MLAPQQKLNCLALLYAQSATNAINYSPLTAKIPFSGLKHILPFSSGEVSASSGTIFQQGRIIGRRRTLQAKAGSFASQKNGAVPKRG